MRLTIGWRAPGIGTVSAVALAVGCGMAASSQPGLSADPPSPPPNETRFDAGCSLLSSEVVDGGCRADWVCSDQGGLSFVCEQTDAGTTCLCIAGDGTSVQSPQADPCQSKDLGKAASSVCTWEVP